MKEQLDFFSAGEKVMREAKGQPDKEKIIELGAAIMSGTTGKYQ